MTPLAPETMVKVWGVSAARAVLGAKLTLLLLGLYVTVPAMVAARFDVGASLTVVVVRVDGSMSSEKPAVMTTPRLTVPAPAPGVLLDGEAPSTVGAVVSAAPEGVLKNKK